MTHIVLAFDDELSRLNQMLAKFGGLAETQFAAAMEALASRDCEALPCIVSSDAELDALEREINEIVIAVIALRAPMAQDLRRLVAVLKVSASLERVGDYAKNIAKRTERVLNQPNTFQTNILNDIAAKVQLMLHDVLDAYMENNVEVAMAVRARDVDVDMMHRDLFQKILEQMRTMPEAVEAGAHMLAIAKNIERIGDFSTGIAEQVHFLVHGTIPENERAKVSITKL